MRRGLFTLTAALALAGCQKAPDEKGKSPIRKGKPETTSLAAQAITQPTEPPLTTLDPLIVFTDPSLCHLNEAGERLMDGLHKYGDGEPITLGRVVASERCLPVFGSPTLHELRSPEAQPGEESVMEARLPVKASWHGLMLVGIESQRTNFSDTWSYRFIFEEPFEKARLTLDKLGFAFSTRGEQAAGDSETAPTVKLTEENGRTFLDCWF